MYVHGTKIQPGESSRWASARTATGLLDEAGEEVGQGLVVSFLVARGCGWPFSFLGAAGFAVLYMC